MAKGIMARFFGGKSKNKNPPVKKSRVVASTPSDLSIQLNKPSTSRSTTPTPSTPTPSPQQMLTIEKDDFSHYLFSDTKDKLTDMNDFINTTANNDIDLHLKNLDNLSDRVSYQTIRSQDEYLTISSSASSSLSLEDALFSHLSTSDTQSEISQYSDCPKIAVRTHKRVDSLFDRPSYSIADTNSNQYIDTIPTDLNHDALYHDKYFCNLYMDALHHLSNKQDPSPAQAFLLFELIARQGHQVYSTLSGRAQLLVSFAQYRAGRILCESADESGINHGLVYLHQSSKNGNARATFILGYYAECRGDLDYACHLYHQAAIMGILPAKVSFGNCILFKRHVAGFQLNDALAMLDEASQQGHSIASLSLALYYEKYSNLQLALKYSQRVKISPSSPIYCVSTYQIGVILLKASRAGLASAEQAFHCFDKAAKAPYYENGILSKCTVALRKQGALSLMGIGTAKNSVAAFSYIQEAATYGDEPANIILGQMYQMGLGCAVDRVKAMQIFTQFEHNIAAKLSRGLLIMKENPQHAFIDFNDVIRYNCTPFDEEHWDCEAIKCEASVRVAVWEYNGIGGTKKNPDRAFRTLKILSEEREYSGAHYWLAWAYLEGIKLEDGSVLVAKDQDKAFACFFKGARENKAECQYQVGLMLREGYSHSKFTKKDALFFFLKAADQDLPAALTQVGVYYFSGAPGTNGRDQQKAFHYFTAAAKYNDSLAIQYLADYMIKNNDNDQINKYQIYAGLNRAAGIERDPIAYRMLALVVDSGSIKLKETYEIPQSKYEVYEDLKEIYKDAKIAAMENGSTIKFQFTLHCLWKAIELQDHSSGQYLCKFFPRMKDNDKLKTIRVFADFEKGVRDKLSFAFAQFLKVSGYRPRALTKYIEVATDNSMTTSIGWNARLEAAKLILIDGEGKSRNKTRIFGWLREMITYNGKNLFVPFILLAKCHDEELCDGCNKTSATQYYEKGLLQERNDKSLDIYARMRLVETYYKSHADSLLKEQLKQVKPLVDSLTDTSEKRSKSADLHYYEGLLALHNGTIVNYRNIAMHHLQESMELGNILACLELGYLYGTMEAREKDADRCFNQVEESKSTIITFKNRITESMVQMRVNRISCSNNYLEEINDMKLAAGITYTFYNMERQAFDWFQEISYLPLARIMILYYKMKDLEQRTPDAITLLSDLMSPFEIEDKLSHYGRMSLSYGQFRLGQCYEHGHGVSVDFIKAGEYYMKACANLQNDEIYERLAEMPIKRDPEFEVQLFTVLRNASRNDIDAVFRLARFYHAMEVNLEDPDVPSSKAAEHYRNAAKQRHAKSCYYYAKYRIHQLQQCIPLKAAQNSKTAVDYLEIAAKKNHGPSFYELGKLKMATGLFEEGIEDLEEADFLGCAAASYRLGELYLQGFSGTVKGYTTTYHLSPKLNEAYRYFYRAHEQNLPLATIQLGHFFETGAFGEQNLSKARSYYMRVLESRQYCEGAAEYALGCLEETYLSVSSQPNANKHRQNAFDWFKRSKDAQNKQANFKIGCYLLHGWVLQDTADKDIKDGIKKLEEEHANSNVQATKELARYYQDQNNNKQAIYYWCKARDMNDAEALEFLAQCFEKGLLGQDVNMENAARYKAEAMDARKRAAETQPSTMGFKTVSSEERNDCLK